VKPDIRIGYGWDSHEFKANIPLKIGGATISHTHGLGGHSDGDVLLHALTDALLGAIAAPDIGSLFPPSDAKWKGAESAVFLREALQRVEAAGYGMVNLDSTGKGEISSLAPGQYLVSFFSDGYAPRSAVMNAPSPLVPLGMTPGGRVDVLSPSAFSGRLVDSSGRPYPLSAYRPDGRVGGPGPVTTWEHLAPGSYQLLVGPQGGEKPFPFSVAEGQTTRVTVN